MSTLLNAWDVRLTEEQVNAEVRALAGWLRKRWLGDRRPVAVYARNSGRTMIASLAVVLSGATLVPLNPHLGAGELPDLLTEAGAGLVFADPSLLPVLRQAVRGMPGPPHVVTWGPDPAGAIDRVEQVVRHAPPVNLAEVAVAAPVLFSSGTTGRPKRVVMPPRLFPDGADVPGFLDWCRQRRFAAYGPHLVAGPLNHSGPQQAIWLLAAGVPVFVPRGFHAATVLDLIERERIATTLMVPTHFIRLLAEHETSPRPYDVSSIKHVTQTGAGCPEDVKRKMIDWWGPVFLETYGGTESGGICFISSAEWLERPGSVGRTLPGYRAFAVAENGAELAAGQVGRLYFEDLSGRGIHYEGEPGLTAAAHLRAGVFTLGESGKVDEDGFVFITDRDSDKIVSGGVNIYPAEAERVLATHPAVADVAAIGVEDPEMGEQLRALVVLREEAQASERELIDYCRAELSTLKAPRSVIFVTGLGRGPMGKLSRRELKRRFGRTPAAAR